MFLQEDFERIGLAFHTSGSDTAELCTDLELMFCQIGETADAKFRQDAVSYFIELGKLGKTSQESLDMTWEVFAPRRKLPLIRWEGFKWYDFWIGGYWDRENRKLYLIVVPCFPISLSFGLAQPRR